MVVGWTGVKQRQEATVSQTVLGASSICSRGKRQILRQRDEVSLAFDAAELLQAPFPGRTLDASRVAFNEHGAAASNTPSVRSARGVPSTRIG